MDPELETYKRTEIAKLTNIFNNAVSSLRIQLNNNINYINRQRINNRLKTYYINNIVNNFNNIINQLKNKLASDIKNINLLLDIPGRIRPNKYALLVGINYKHTEYELLGCINDTNNIKTLLESKYSYKNFTFLTDDTNKKPTKENILTELTNLLLNSKSGDSLFFLYSGHGTATIDLNGDESDQQDEVIVPCDFTNIESCILDDDINKIIQNNLKSGVKLFALFDCCFSGTILDLKYNYLTDLEQVNINPNSSDTDGNVIMISGCKDSQSSADVSVNYQNKIMNSGAMTYCFLQAIDQFGPNVSLKKCIEHMRSVLSENGFEQIPQLSSGKSIDINTITLSL